MTEPRDTSTDWHPRPEKFTDDGLLPDLTDGQVEEHRRKPEAAEQVDADRPLDHDGDED